MRVQRACACTEHLCSAKQAISILITTYIAIGIDICAPVSLICEMGTIIAPTSLIRPRVAATRINIYKC